MSCFTPHSDESLHGFIFRIMTLHGCFDYQVMLTRSGWAINPSIPKHLNDFFEQLSSSDLVGLVTRSFFQESSENVFTSPLDFNSVFQTSFRPKKDTVKTGKCYPIRWCKDCVSEQISLYGYGFFKASWLHGVQCVSHQKPLLELRSVGYGGVNDLANAAREIVSGRNSEYSKSVSMASKNSFKPPLSLARRGLRLSKCAEEAFSRRIRTKEQLRFVEGETCTADYGVVPAVAKKAFHAYESRSSERRLLSFHYEHVAACHYDSLKGFLYEALELEEAFLSLGGGKSAKTLILKDKTKKCSQCMVSECSANKLIMATRVCGASNSNLSRNPCDAQLEEYERQLEIRAARLRLHHNWTQVEKQAYWFQAEKSYLGLTSLEPLMNTSGLEADYPS